VHGLAICVARLDYCGVVVLIVTSHVPWFHFVFYCDHLVQFVYITSFLALGAMAVCFVLRDEFRRPSYRWIRFSKNTLCMFLSQHVAVYLSMPHICL